jgi:hypothetical protein
VKAADSKKRPVMAHRRFTFTWAENEFAKASRLEQQGRRS